MKHRLTLFAGGVFAFWLLLAFPTQILFGPRQVGISAAAMVLCLVPGAVSLLCSRGDSPSPTQLLLTMLIGTFARMLAALGGGLALYVAVPFFSHVSFWLWLVVFYVASLAWEVCLLVINRRGPATAHSMIIPQV